ncbi:hypothetical protein [Usitatibacter palustris]|uniref:GlsB/YeaQ/YmgE family stress response membrane protein n=1 Tax=Usitatibacter palustris TaxID=2732487 RepID=A0A6M4HAA7_9PROT|nr:hypothetical protein [Usitatibacter palustris]QJR16729.1 hypothetical protein DSM104440_03565 [Usitatibacter palustris]
MSLVVAMFLGAFLGWASHSFTGLNEGRGRIAAVFIGAAGGFIGAKMVAPMFVAAPVVGSSFSVSTLAFAGIVAVAALIAGSMIHSRWDI